MTPEDDWACAVVAKMCQRYPEAVSHGAALAEALWAMDTADDDPERWERELSALLASRWGKR